MGWVILETVTIPVRKTSTGFSEKPVELQLKSYSGYIRAGISYMETTFDETFNTVIGSSKTYKVTCTLTVDGTNYYFDTGSFLGSSFDGVSSPKVGASWRYRSKISTSYTLYESVYSPPSTPSSISVPSTLEGGKSYSISWGSGSGASSYRLERSVNGGAYSQIYSGSSRSYTDTILSTWNTVTYRVGAYNTDGYSSYITSPTRTVKHFPEMKIMVSGALKTYDNGWVRIDGQLKQIDKIVTRVNGVLKEV